MLNPSPNEARQIVDQPLITTIELNKMLTLTNTGQRCGYSRRMHAIAPLKVFLSYIFTSADTITIYGICSLIKFQIY